MVSGAHQVAGRDVMLSLVIEQQTFFSFRCRQTVFDRTYVDNQLLLEYGPIGQKTCAFMAVRTNRRDVFLYGQSVVGLPQDVIDFEGPVTCLIHKRLRRVACLAFPDSPRNSVLLDECASLAVPANDEVQFDTNRMGCCKGARAQHRQISRRVAVLRGVRGSVLRGCEKESPQASHFLFSRSSDDGCVAASVGRAFEAKGLSLIPGLPNLLEDGITRSRKQDGMATASEHTVGFGRREIVFRAGTPKPSNTERKIKIHKLVLARMLPRRYVPISLQKI